MGQVLERMERQMGLPPNTLAFAYVGEPLPTFGLENPMHFGPL